MVHTALRAALIQDAQFTTTFLTRLRLDICMNYAIRHMKNVRTWFILHSNEVSDPGVLPPLPAHQLILPVIVVPQLSNWNHLSFGLAPGDGALFAPDNHRPSMGQSLN